MSMFKKGDEEYNWKVGFDNAEVSSFGPRSLALVIKCLIDLAKHQSHTILQQFQKVRIIADEISKGILMALKIYDTCPSKESVKDNSFILPVYSFISQYAKYSTPYTNYKDNDTLEQLLGDSIPYKFVLETKSQLYHYCRALAMKVEALASNQVLDVIFYPIHTIIMKMHNYSLLNLPSRLNT